MADIRLVAAPTDVKQKAKYVIPAHRGKATSTKQQPRLKPSTQRPPLATVAMQATLATVVLDGQVNTLPDLKLETLAQDSKLGILNVVKQNGTHDECNGRITQHLHLHASQMDLKDAPELTEISVASALGDCTRVVSGLTYDACNMIRLAAQPPKSVDFDTNQLVSFGGTMVIVQPQMDTVTRNCAAYEKERSSIGGLPVVLHDTSTDTKLARSGFSSHLNVYWGSSLPTASDKKKALLWLDSNDWKFPTGFHFPDYARVASSDDPEQEPFETILSQTPFHRAVVVHRDTWLNGPAAQEKAGTRVVDVVSKKYWIYTQSSTSSKKKPTDDIDIYLLIRK